MTHVDADILALLALGDHDETDQEAQHLADCPSCQDELRRLTDVVATATGAAFDLGFRIQQPPGRVLDRIYQQLDMARPPGASGRADGLTSRPFPPENLVSSRQAPSAPKARWRRPVAGIAAGLLLGAGIGILGEHIADQPRSAAAGSSTRLHPLPQFAHWRTASAIATLTVGPQGPTLSIRLSAPASPGFFEVWLLGRDGVSMISLGDLNKARAGQFSLPPGVNLGFYSRIDISLQPFNGSTAHSAVSVVRGYVPEDR